MYFNEDEHHNGLPQFVRHHEALVISNLFLLDSTHIKKVWAVILKLSACLVSIFNVEKIKQELSDMLEMVRVTSTLIEICIQ